MLTPPSSTIFHRIDADIGESRCRLLELPRCRLLELPRELRNLIYEYVFDDAASKELELLAFKLHLPRNAITATNHQLLAETLPLEKVAISLFWRLHDFRMTLKHKKRSGCARDTVYRDKLHQACVELTPIAKLTRFELHCKESKCKVLWELHSHRKLVVSTWMISEVSGKRVECGRLVATARKNEQSLVLGKVLDYALKGTFRDEEEEHMQESTRMVRTICDEHV